MRILQDIYPSSSFCICWYSIMILFYSEASVISGDYFKQCHTLLCPLEAEFGKSLYFQGTCWMFWWVCPSPSTCIKMSYPLSPPHCHWFLPATFLLEHSHRLSSSWSEALLPPTTTHIGHRAPPAVCLLRATAPCSLHFLGLCLVLSQQPSALSQLLVSSPVHLHHNGSSWDSITQTDCFIPRPCADVFRDILCPPTQSSCSKFATCGVSHLCIPAVSWLSGPSSLSNYPGNLKFRKGVPGPPISENCIKFAGKEDGPGHHYLKKKKPNNFPDDVTCGRNENYVCCPAYFCLITFGSFLLCISIEVFSF